MNRYAVFVDAGYLLAAGQWACSGEFRSRPAYEANLPYLLETVKALAEKEYPAGELLRVYWYDAAAGRLPTSELVGLSLEDDVSLRMGTLTSKGVQKGVDALIILDMYDHALKGLVTDSLLIAGDGDLVEGVIRSQSLGVRTTVMSINTPQSTTSPDLQKSADRHRWFDHTRICKAFKMIEPTSASVGDTRHRRPRDRMATFDTDETSISKAREAAAGYARQMVESNPEAARAALKTRPRVPHHVDQALIAATLRHLNLDPATILTSETVLAMRDSFVSEAAARLEGHAVSDCQS